MMKIEASGASFSSCIDRFVTSGYRKGLNAYEQLEQLSKIEGLSGIPVMYPLEFKGADYIKETYAKIGKEVGTIAPDTYINPLWKNGSLTSRDPDIRNKMEQDIKASMDLCAYLNGADVLLWMAHDGYDYPFEDDYVSRWNLLLDGIAKCCDHRPDVTLTIEYKTKEPRTRQYISDIGKSLLICKELGKKNLGVVVDVGHSLFAGENPAEAIALAANYGKLSHIHLNDNYRSWDDDLLPGGIHFWEMLEVFYMLDRVKYNGWLTIDIWPSRVNGFEALEESIERIRMFERLTNNLPKEKIMQLQKQNETMKISKLLREYCIK